MDFISAVKCLAYAQESFGDLVDVSLDNHIFGVKGNPNSLSALGFGNLGKVCGQGK